MLSLSVGCRHKLHFHNTAPESHLSRVPDDRFENESGEISNVYVDLRVMYALTIHVAYIYYAFQLHCPVVILYGR